MADYWTHFQFLVLGAPEHTAWLAAVHDIARNLIAGEAVKSDGGLGVLATPDAADQGLVRAAANLAQEFGWLGEPGIVISPHQPEVAGVWITSTDGLGSPHYAAALAQSYLQHIACDAVIVFPWSLTCSHPCSDAYGGGSAVVTRQAVELFDIK